MDETQAEKRCGLALLLLFAEIGNPLANCPAEVAENNG